MKRPRRTSLAVALVLGACSGRGDKAKLPEKPPESAAAAAPVPAADSLSAPRAGEGPEELADAAWTGTTEPHRRATLTPRVSGVVARVHVREGDLPKRGDPLVSLDLEDFTLRLRQAEAAHQAARSQHDGLHVEWERAKALLADRSVPEAQYDAVNARYEAARAGLAQAEVAVDMAKKGLRDAVIRAPYDGLITRRFVSEGEYATTMPATQLVTIEEVGTLDLRVQVPASETERVRVGDPLRVRVAGLELRARVTRVVGSVDPRTRTFSVIAEIPNADRALRPGLFARVALDGPPAPPPGDAP